jgi:hypothetical protein
MSCWLQLWCQGNALPCGQAACFPDSHLAFCIYALHFVQDVVALCCVCSVFFHKAMTDGCNLQGVAVSDPAPAKKEAPAKKQAAKPAKK